MRKIKILSLAIALTSASSLALAMQALDEDQLGDVTGEGLGTVFEDLAIDSDDYRTYPESAFKVKLRLNDEGFVYARDSNNNIIYDAYGPVIAEDNNEYLVLSELRMHKTGEPGVGGFIGTVKNPLLQDQIVEVDNNGNTLLVLESSYPGKHLTMQERNFFRYAPSIGGITMANSGNRNVRGDYKGLPVNFFSSTSSIGNLNAFHNRADQFANNLQNFENQLDLMSDKFDLHLRVDAITSENLKESADNQFLSYLDLIGMRYYGKTDYTWADPTYGLVTTGSQGLRVDELRLTTDINYAQSSVISAKEVDIYLPGSLAQPHVTNIIMYDQVKRGEWKSGTRVGEALPQLRTEVTALPSGQAPQGHVIIQQLAFGDPNDPELITGVDDIYLRDRSGNVVAVVEDVVHRAFIPKTVFYNEQIDKYNAENPGANLPNIPNQNVIEIRGLEIQRQVMVTQDLGR